MVPSSHLKGFSASMGYNSTKPTPIESHRLIFPLFMSGRFSVNSDNVKKTLLNLK